MDLAEFTGEQSDVSFAKYNTESNVGSTLLGIPLAATVDTGISIWNSLAPEKYEYQTRDVLSNINENLATVYDENPETINALSFVGGIIAPSGLALKGMNYLRSGAKGANWFSTAGQTQRMANIKAAYEGSGKASSAFRGALWENRFAVAGNALVDTAVMEGVLYATLNAHPYMEDYVKDPLKNSAMNMLFGVGVVGGFGLIGQRFATKGIMQEVEMASHKTLLEGMKSYEVTENLSGRIATHHANSENWKSILETRGDTLTEHTKKLLEFNIANADAAKFSIFDTLASPSFTKSLEGMENGGMAYKQTLIDRIAADPARFAGIDTITLGRVGEVTDLSQANKSPFFSDTVIPGEKLPLTVESPATGRIRPATVAYNPQLDVFMMPSDVRAYGSAADLGYTNVDELLKGTPRDWHSYPNRDIGIESPFTSSPHMDAQYLKALAHFDRLPVEDLYRPIAIAPDDFGMLQGYLARVKKEMQSNPTFDVSQTKLTITKATPVWGEINADLMAQAIASKIPVSTVPHSAGVASHELGLPPIKKTILEDTIKWLKSKEGLSTDLMRSPNLSPEAKKLAHASSGTDELGNHPGFGGMHLMERGLNDWRRGNKAPQRLLTEKEAEYFGNDRYKTYRSSGYSHAEAMEAFGEEPSILGQVVKELWESPESVKLRQYLAQQADSEGYIYLLRGMRNAAKGSRAGESFTPSTYVANEFGKPSMYRVHTDDVIGFLGSFKGSRLGGELELVVDSATHPVVTALPSGARTASTAIDVESLKNTIKAHSTNTSASVSPIEAMDGLIKDKMAKVKEYISRGIPDDVISRNLNIPSSTVRKIASGKSEDLLAMEPFSIYTDASAIEGYLSPLNRTVLFRTNSNKIPHAQIRSNIGANITSNVDDVVKETFLASSQSVLMREVSSFFLGTEFRSLRDVIRDKLSLISNPALGNKFLGSTDHSLRGMREIGPIATYLGKMRTDLTNRAVDKFFSSIKDDMYTMARDKAALVEFNTADAVNAKLKGYRIYKDRQFWQLDPDNPTKQILTADGKTATVENWIAVEHNGVPFRVTTDSVDNVLTWAGNSGRELYMQNETLRKIPGLGKLSDIGYWLPSFSPKDKYIAYVIDKATQATTLLHGKTPEDLQSAIQAFGGKSGVVVGKTHDIIQHGTEQQLFNILAGRHDPMFMQSADTTMLHGGSSSAARISTSTERLVEMVNAYEHQLSYNIGNVMEFQLSDVFDYLHTSSKYTQAAVKMQPGASGLIKKTEKDAAAVLMNTIMGKTNLDQYGLWRGTNQIYSAILEKTFGTIQDVLEPVLNSGKNLFGKGKNLSDKQYDELQLQLEARGIPNPFKAYQEAEARQLFHRDRTAKTEALSSRITVLANTLAATTLLRVGELGQAYVNAISLPILMTSEISSKLPAKFMDSALHGSPELSVVETMYNGWRYAHRPEALPYIQRGKELNLFKGVVSEADELFARTRSLDPGLLSTLESSLRSKLVERLSLATDFSEQFVREKAFSTGVYIAKTSYPTLPDAGIMVFARDFMDRTIGNYAAAQRPTMFQGTFGVAMGLFQTYMLTMAQSLYRHLEKGEFKAIAKTMLAQATIFGAKSLPGFNIVSEQIGKHFSDDNFDLVTGTFRALPDRVAEMTIYGLPSSFSQAAITTRGEIQPRVPDPFEGVGAIPAVALSIQAFDAMKKVATSIFQADQTAGKGIMEAISMQSISRPLARMSELVSGHSVTNKGNLIAGPDEIWTWNSALARGLATRPIQEARARDAIHLNSMYGSVDRDNRQNITMQLRSHMRANTLDDNVVANLAEEYMRTGSPQGWNSAVNTAIAQTELPANQTVRNYLAPNSPTIMMIDNMH